MCTLLKHLKAKEKQWEKEKKHWALMKLKYLGENKLRNFLKIDDGWLVIDMGIKQGE